MIHGSLLACFYCGVDEKPLKIILFTIIGTFFLGSVCVLIWALARGAFRNVEKAKFDLFEAERRL